MAARLTLAFSASDKAKLDELRELFRALHGFAPENYSDTLRAALNFTLEAKKKEFSEKHPAGARLGLKEPGAPASRRPSR